MARKASAETSEVNVPLPSSSDEEVKKEVKNDKKPIKPSKSSYASMILYPENARHRAMVKILEENALGGLYGFRATWILHNRDEYGRKEVEEGKALNYEQWSCDPDCWSLHVAGEVKKPHYHVLVKFPYPVTECRMKSWASGMGIEKNLVEIVECPVAFAMYLTHQDPLSRAYGKVVYNDDEICGDRTLVVRDDEEMFERFLACLRWYFEDAESQGNWTDAMIHIHQFGLLDYVKSQGFYATKMISDYVGRVSERNRLNKEIQYIERSAYAYDGVEQLLSRASRE